MSHSLEWLSWGLRPGCLSSSIGSSHRIRHRHHVPFPLHQACRPGGMATSWGYAPDAGLASSLPRLPPPPAFPLQSLGSAHERSQDHTILSRNPEILALALFLTQHCKPQSDPREALLFLQPPRIPGALPHSPQQSSVSRLQAEIPGKEDLQSTPHKATILREICRNYCS